MLETPLTLDAWFHCGVCGTTLFFMGEEGFDLYFRHDEGTCPKCEAKVDLWSVLLNAVTNNFMLTGAFVAIGARTTIFDLDIKPNDTKELVFAAVGVPSDAIVLSINYTPQGGGVFPIEIHGNTPHRGLPGDRVWLFGRPFPKPAGEADATVSCSVTWMKPPDDDDGWSHLLDAYRAYAVGHWRSIVVPANIAAESAISKALYEAIVRRTSKADAENFLSDGATYAHQLRVVLPIMSTLEGIPPLDQTVRGQLNRLRKLRNSVAHSGSLPTALDKEEAARLLVAATIGFQYGRFFRRRLAETGMPRDPKVADDKAEARS